MPPLVSKEGVQHLHLRPAMRFLEGRNQDRKGQSFRDFGIGDKVQGKFLIGDRHLPINPRGRFRNESSAGTGQALIRVKISFPRPA
ncbi:hypothetical protein ACM43_29110 [Bradyrhizobium sp. CCBAU 45321]|nr:hypothetical protein [Bradyrhizobium sp. CCBAU 45321]